MGKSSSAGGHHPQPGGHHGGPHMPPAPQPWPHGGHGPQPGYTRTLSFQSGMFRFLSDAENSMNTAVGRLNAAGYLVYESRLNGRQYSLVFTAPAYARIQTYASGQYSFMSDAEAGMAQAVRAMEQSGKMVLEARLNGRDFVISYLER